MTDFSEPVHESDDEFWANLAAEREQPPEPPPHQLDAEPADAPVGNPAQWVHEQRELAKTVPCADCKREPGQHCVRVGTTEPLRKFPAHPRRILAARRRKDRP